MNKKLNLKMLSYCILIITLTTMVAIGVYAYSALAKELTDNAQKTALLHLKSSEALLTEKIKNIERFTDIVSMNQDLQQLLNEQELNSQSIQAVLMSLCTDYEEVEGCVFVNNQGKVYNYNLTELSEDDIFYMQVAYTHLNEKRGMLRWFRVEQDESIRPFLNKYVVCGTIVFEQQPVKLYIFIKEEVFDEVIDNSSENAVVGIMDENARLIVSDDETLFLSMLNEKPSNLLDVYEQKEGIIDFVYSHDHYVGVHYQSNITDLKFMEFYPKNIFYNKLYYMLFFMIIIVSISLGIIICLYTIVLKYYSNPLQKLSVIMENFDDSSLKKHIEIDGGEEIGKIVDGFEKMTCKINEIITDIKREEEKKRQAEILALHYQIHPHFLYNTIHSIRILALKAKQAEIARALQLLAQLFSQILSSAQDGFLPLREEMDFVKAYVELLQIRYSNMIEVSYCIEPEVLNCFIPNMIIQPIVENAVSHGLSSKLTERKTPAKLCINARQSGDDCLIEIMDNGIGMSEEQIQKISSESRRSGLNNIGLKNITERLKLLYGDDYGIEVDTKKDVYTNVLIRLPKNSK